MSRAGSIRRQHVEVVVAGSGVEREVLVFGQRYGEDGVDVASASADGDGCLVSDGHLEVDTRVEEVDVCVAVDAFGSELLRLHLDLHV